MSEQVKTASEQIKEVAADTKPKRVWEIDMLRGFLILFVIFDHMMFDFGMYGGMFSSGLMQNVSGFASSYWHSGIRSATHGYFVGGFVFLSGVSTRFSKNNIKKAARVLLFAFLLTWITYIGDSIGMFEDNIMLFGVLHMLGFSGLLYALWEKLRKPLEKFKASSWVFLGITFAAGVAMLIIGYYYQANPVQFDASADGPVKKLLALLVKTVQGNSSVGSSLSPGDYFSLLPWCGWFFVGAAIAPVLYKNKTTLLPKVNERYFKPLMFCGRNSLYLYLLGQVVVLGVLYLFLGW